MPSIPDVRVEIARPSSVTVSYLDRDGKMQTLVAEGFLATAIQHEMDHLEGTLFIDHLSRLKREMMLKKLTKARKASQREEVD